MVCWLNKSLYGLSLVFSVCHEAKSETSLFIYRRGDETAYLLLYVDDIVLTASSQQLLERVISL